MSPTARLRRASVAFATTTAFAVFCSSVPAQSDPQPTGQEKSATKLVDHDYAFELKRPERGWELLDELEAATLNEDSVAIARQSSTTLVVIVEQVGDSLDIDAYRDLAIESFGLPMKSAPELSDAQLGGVDGRQYEATADVGILVEFTSRIAIREGYAFQLLLSRRAGALDARAVERVFDSFSFRDGPIRGRAATFVQQNASGADWILEGGVYRNVAIGPGFALEPRTDLARVLFGTDLRALSATADVGLVTADEGLYGLVEHRVAHDDDYAQSWFALNSWRPDGIDAEQLELEALDASRTFETWTEDLDDTTFRYRQSQFVEDGTAWILTFWSVDGDAAATENLPALARSLRRLRETERDETRTRLTQPDFRHCQISETSAWRADTFVDYERGVAWRAPEGLVVRPAIGEILEETGLGHLAFDALLPGVGLDLSLAYDDAAGRDEATYHADSVTAYVGEATVASTSEVEKIRGIGLDLLVTRTRIVTGLGVEQLVVATAIHGDLGIDVLVTGATTAFDSNPNLLERILANVAHHDLTATETLDDRYIDRRFGFEITLEDGERVTPNQQGGVELGSSGNVVQLEKDGDVRMAFVAALLSVTPEVGRDMMKRDAARRLPGAGILFGSKEREWEQGQLGERGEFTTEKTEFGGVLAAAAEMHILVRGATGFVVTLVGDAATRKALARRVRLLDDPLAR
jgi:hypothetical protein